MTDYPSKGLAWPWPLKIDPEERARREERLKAALAERRAKMFAPKEKETANG